LDSGVLGVKSFLIDSGISEFPPMSLEDLEKAVPLLAQSGLPYLFHASLTEAPRSPRPQESYEDFSSHDHEPSKMKPLILLWRSQKNMNAEVISFTSLLQTP